MLIRFRVRNFLSFREEIEFSMVAGKVQKHPEHVMRNTNNINVDLLRAAIIYGANASGKSNLVKAIDFAKFMVVKGVRPKASIPRRIFKLDPACSTQPSRFEFELQHKGKIYVYGFSLDSKRIHEEWLSEINKKNKKVLFRRITSSDDVNTIEFGIKVGKKDADFLQYVARGTAPNCLFLQESIEKNIKYFADVYEWFDEVLVIIFPGSFHSLAPIGFGSKTKFGDLLVDYLERFGTGVCGYSLQPVVEPSSEIPKKVLEEMEQSISEKQSTAVLNLHGQRYFIKKETEQLEVFKLLLGHRNKSCESDVFFEMDEESDGTLRLLDLIPVLDSTEDSRNTVIIIDELDRSLHPNLSYDFITIFLQAITHRQIIVTTHESGLLDLNLVRRDEVWFIEKDQYGSSSVYSLEEFAPRYDKDIRKGYMLGRFGAVPVISQPNIDGE